MASSKTQRPFLLQVGLVLFVIFVLAVLGGLAALGLRDERQRDQAYKTACEEIGGRALVAAGRRECHVPLTREKLNASD